jgi:hypothetical protein
MSMGAFASFRVEAVGGQVDLGVWSDCGKKSVRDEVRTKDCDAKGQ